MKKALRKLHDQLEKASEAMQDHYEKMDLDEYEKSTTGEDSVYIQVQIEELMGEIDAFLDNC